MGLIAGVAAAVVSDVDGDVVLGNFLADITFLDGGGGEQMEEEEESNEVDEDDGADLDGVYDDEESDVEDLLADPIFTAS